MTHFLHLASDAHKTTHSWSIGPPSRQWHLVRVDTGHVGQHIKLPMSFKKITVFYDVWVSLLKFGSRTILLMKKDPIPICEGTEWCTLKCCHFNLWAFAHKWDSCFDCIGPNTFNCQFLRCNVWMGHSGGKEKQSRYLLLYLHASTEMSNSQSKKYTLQSITEWVKYCVYTFKIHWFALIIISWIFILVINYNLNVISDISSFFMSL